MPGHIEEACHTDRGIDQEARGIDAGIMELALQGVVGEVANLAEVGEHVADAILEELRGHRLVAARQRLQRVGVQGVVEHEDRPIEGLPGVLLAGLGDDGQQRQACHGQQAQGMPHPVRAMITHVLVSLNFQHERPSRPTIFQARSICLSKFFAATTDR
ncbi:hypothetical protein D3C81_1678760 [compost metagenome]